MGFTNYINMEGNIIMKKILALLLALLTVSSVLAGCSTGDTGTSSNDTTDVQQSQETTAETTEAGPKLELEVKDWEGRQFRVLGRDGNANKQFNNFEIDAAEQTGEIIVDAVYKRNADIKEKYNVEVKGVYDAAPITALQKYVNAGEDAVELGFNVLNDIKTLATGGYLVEMSDLPHVNYENPWWSKPVNDATSINGKFYATTSSFSLMDKNRMYIIVFNKEMAEEYSLGNLYEIVRNGQFTVDKATEMVKKVAADVDGDGVMTDADRYGLVMDSYNGFFVQLQAMNNWLISKDKDDMPVVSMNSEKMVNSIDKAFGLCFNKETSLTCEWFKDKVDYSYWSVSSRVFKAGRALFATSFINHPVGLKSYSADCDFDYGIVPFPKADEAQEHYVSVPDPAWATLFSIPMTNTDLDFTGYMLELLSYTSYETVMPAYYETSAKGKYTYDKESEEMLDLIFATPHYDLGMVYNWGNMKGILNTIASKGENNFASLYASAEPTILSEMETTVEQILALK